MVPDEPNGLKANPAFRRTVMPSLSRHLVICNQERRGPSTALGMTVGKPDRI
jgi:hypothetical protein